MNRYPIASCAFEIHPSGSSIQLLPSGDFKAIDGRPTDVASGYWRLTAEVAARVISKVASRITDVVIDYEHQTLNGPSNGLPAPAAGWIKGASLVWQDGRGLFAENVQWTDKAAAMIKAREYRYISPVFSYDHRTGEVLDIHHVALTNFPALDGMDSLTSLAAARFNPASKFDGHIKAIVDGRLDSAAVSACRALGVSLDDYLKTLGG
ncbi:TPA: phage protease [Pseudomonas aeruginosa]